MNMKNMYLIIGAIFIALFVGFFALNSFIYNEKQGDPNKTIEPYRGTLTGEYVCLPHADKTGPQTLECAFGIKTLSGEYYAVDFNMMSQPRPQLETGDKFTATGLITPIENLSSDHWQKYDIEGIFSVTDSVQKN
jgi:hypothetical protein